MLATNYMLRALCRKETTCSETYSRIVMLLNILETSNNMFKTRCAKKVHSDDVLHGRTVGVTWGVSFVRDVLRDAGLCSLVA